MKSSKHGSKLAEKRGVQIKYDAEVEEIEIEKNASLTP